MLILAATLAQWAWWVAGWGLAGTAAAALLWALFADRARGRRRCPSCWYDLSGVGLTCPECGSTARSERALRRTRRRWRIAVVMAVLVVVGTQVAGQAGRGKEKWTRFVPTSVLVWMASPVTPREQASFFSGNAGWRNTVMQALSERGGVDGGSGRLWGWQWAIAQSMSRRLSPGEVTSMLRLRTRHAAGEKRELRVLIVDNATPIIGECLLTVRSLEDEEGGGVRCDVGLPRWTMVRSGTPTAGGAVTLSRSGSVISGLTMGVSARSGGPDPVLTLPELAIGKHVERYAVEMRAGGWLIGRWVREVTVEVCATLDEAVPPVDTEEVRAQVREAVIARPMDGGKSVRLSVAKSVPRLGTLPLTVEMVVDGEVAQTGPLPWKFYLPASGEVRLRIHSDQMRALDDYTADAWWSGVIEMPVAEWVKDVPDFRW